MKPINTARRMSGVNFFSPKIYTMADRVNAPAPKAIAERSIVIQRPQGTESYIFVTSRPLTNTLIAEMRPMAIKIQSNMSQTKKPGDIFNGLRVDGVVAAISTGPPLVGYSKRSAQHPAPRAGE